jgi:activator of HSP90 ATPase
MADNIKLSVTLAANPSTIYKAWLDKEEHSAFTKSKTIIEKKVGSKFTAGDGYIEGEIKKMILSKKIVMTWRTTDFPEGSEDSLLEVNLEGNDSSTKMIIVHENLPEGDGKKYRKGWKDHYFTPMKEYFS